VSGACVETELHGVAASHAISRSSFRATAPRLNQLAFRQPAGDSEGDFTVIVGASGVLIGKSIQFA